MKRKIIKFCSAILIFLLFSVFITVNAENISEFELDISNKARAVYLYSYDAKRVIYSEGEDISISPGPTAKIMTGIIACERFSDELDRRVLITSEMVENISGNSMNLKSGMNLTVMDLIYGTICGGNNDAAQVLALLCEDSIADFVMQMNLYADKLNMTSTKYCDPTGMDEENSYTTARDVAMLSIYAAQNELYIGISSSPSYTVKQQTENEFTIYNRNALASQFSAQGYINKNAKGIIAGRDDNGFTVVATAEKNDMHMLCVVIGAVSDANDIYSYKIANRLFEYLPRNYSKILIAKKDSVIASANVELSVQNGQDTKADCILPYDVYAFLPYDVNVDTDITSIVYLHEDAYTAPLCKGRVMGGVDFYYKDKLIATSEIIANEYVEENKILIFLKNAKEFLLSRTFISFAILFMIGLIVYLIVERKAHKKHRTSLYPHRKFH